MQALTRLYPAHTFCTDANDKPIGDCFGKIIPVTIYMDRLGSLKFWLKDALNKKRGLSMIENKIRSPHLKLPDPTPNPPNSQYTTPSPQRNRRQQQDNQNHLLPSPSPRNNNGFNPEEVGVNLKDSLGILRFSMNEIVTEHMVRRRYMELARKFHPEKNNPTTSGRNREEATTYFQLINNAQQYLRHIV